MKIIENHYERSMALLASQFRNRKSDGSLTNLQKLIKAIVSQAQFAENVNDQLFSERWLETAIGDQLDELGIILGVFRAINESDEDYRERLQFQIFINSSVGSPEDAINILSFLNRSNHIGYFEIYPASYHLECDGLKFPSPPNDLNDALFQASPAGVNYASITASYEVEIPFITGMDVSSQALSVAPNLNDPFELVNLEMEPYNALLYINAGSTFGSDSDIGGLDELGFASPTAGQIGELIQKNGNFPPRR